MPSRILREGINTSPKVNALSPMAELFYRRLMTVADDYGRFYANPATLRGACWPTCPEKVTEAQISGWLSECLATANQLQASTHQGVLSTSRLRILVSRPAERANSRNLLKITCLAIAKQMLNLVVFRSRISIFVFRSRESLNNLRQKTAQGRRMAPAYLSMKFLLKGRSGLRRNCSGQRNGPRRLSHFSGITGGDRLVQMLAKLTGLPLGKTGAGKMIRVVDRCFRLLRNHSENLPTEKAIRIGHENILRTGRL